MENSNQNQVETSDKKNYDELNNPLTIYLPTQGYSIELTDEEYQKYFGSN